MPRTAAETGLSDPFDPIQAIRGSARVSLQAISRTLGSQRQRTTRVVAELNNGLSRRDPSPIEGRAYMRIITGHKAKE